MTKALYSMSPASHSGASRPNRAAESHPASLMTAVQRYLDLMYDCDTSHFDEVFQPTAHLHGFRDGEMKAWSMEVYRDILNRRTSSKSQNIPREDEILLVDFASPTMALVKVRVRIAVGVFVDFLTWHCEDGQWLITSKGFHLESAHANGRPV